MGKGWGGFLDEALGIIDGLFGLSPEERVKKMKNKKATLERERDAILKKPASDKSAARIIAINEQLRGIEERLANEA